MGPEPRWKERIAASGNEFIAASKQATYLSLIWGDSEKPQALQGNISSSLLDLHHLSSLDLSHNDFNESNPRIYWFFNLKYLYFFEAQFGHLSNLESIVLSENNFNCVRNLQWLPHLSSLKQLGLNSVVRTYVDIVRDMCYVILANLLTKRTCNWIDLWWVYYFKEQEFKSSIEVMQIYPRNKWRNVVY